MAVAKGVLSPTDDCASSARIAVIACRRWAHCGSSESGSPEATPQQFCLAAVLFALSDRAPVANCSVGRGPWTSLALLQRRTRGGGLYGATPFNPHPTPQVPDG